MKTIEEKAKAYDEIIERAKTMLSAGEVMYGKENNASQLITDLIPELAESEDEKVWQWIREHINHDGTNMFDKAVAWLEKQKELLTPEEKMKHPLYVEGFEAGKQVGSQYEAVFEKQKEQKPYCLSNDDLEDAAREFRGKCLPPIEPISDELIDIIKGEFEGFRNLLKKNGIDYEPQRGYWEGFARLFDSSAREYVKEQKPAEKQDYSGLNDFERAIHRGFLCAGVENVPVTIIKETAQDCLAHLPAEWSEEDEKMIEGLIKGLEDRIGFDRKGSLGYSRQEFINRLKRLRPSWKPSEEQMKRLADAVESWRGGIGYNELKSLYNDLLKLKSL